MKIKDSVVIVTGASGGIGLALAKSLSKEGAKVVLAARSADKLKKLEGEIPNSFAVTTDMTKPNDIKKLVEATVTKFGRVDILINNAGQGMWGPVEKINLADYAAIMELNVFAVVRAMQAVIPAMRKEGKGMILNISSRVSKNYFPELAAYASTKYALNAITLTAREELKIDGITVSAFHPKLTKTDFGTNVRGGDGSSDIDFNAPDIDTPEMVADAVIKQIVSEEAEVGM